MIPFEVFPACTRWVGFIHPATAGDAYFPPIDVCIDPELLSGITKYNAEVIGWFQNGLGRPRVDARPARRWNPALATGSRVEDADGNGENDVLPIPSPAAIEGRNGTVRHEAVALE